MENDFLLIKECQSGSIEAFNEIVRTNREQIHKLAYHITGNFEDANDISQEVFIRAYKSINTFKGNASVSTWLRRIAINLSINHIKKESKHQNTREIFREEDYSSLLRHISTPLDIIETKELSQRISESIRSLPLKERIVFVLQVQHGLSYREIADSVCCPLGTVMSRLDRARRILRDKLKDYIV